MEMELVGIVKTLWRWKWLIVGLMAFTAVGLFILTNNEEPTYRARTTMQITRPDREDVAVIDAYAFTSSRDEITIAINNFLQIARYDEVRRRTQAQLGIDEPYAVTVDAELGADLIFINIEASTPQLAADIANAHTAVAITYFGELRARPSQKALEHFDSQLAIAREEVLDAEAALSAFQQEHNILNLPEELRRQQLLLTQLEEAQGQFLLNSLIIGAEPIPNALTPELRLLDLEVQLKQQELARLRLELAALENQMSATTLPITASDPDVAEDAESPPTAVVSPLATLQSEYETEIYETELAISDLSAARLELEKNQLLNHGQYDSTILQDFAALITQRRQQLAQVSALEPTYNLLQQEVTRTRDKYQLLNDKYVETELRQAFTSEAMFVQTLNQALPPTGARSNSSRTILFGLVGALGLSIILAFLLDYLIPQRPPTNAEKGYNQPPLPESQANFPPVVGTRIDQQHGS